MKDKRAIALFMLIITIVVMIIIASTIIVSYNSILSSTHKKEFAKEIYTIQKLVENYKFMNDRYPLSSQVTIDISSFNEEEKKQFEGEIDFSTGSIKLNKIDLYEAGVENVKRGTEKNSDTTDMYAYSTTTGKVYYIKGVKIDKNMYYTLTSDLKKQLEL